jgi:hypothetical protein
MDLQQRLMVEVMVQKAVIGALIASHPEPEKLRHYILGAATSIGATAFTGDQAAGLQATFDALVQECVGLTARR